MLILPRKIINTKLYRLYNIVLVIRYTHPESGSAVDLPAAGSLGGEHGGAGQTLAQPPRGAREGAQRCLRQVSLKILHS